jgi:hypothetical protein
MELASSRDAPESIIIQPARAAALRELWEVVATVWKRTQRVSRSEYGRFPDSHHEIEKAACRGLF